MYRGREICQLNDKISGSTGRDRIYRGESRVEFEGFELPRIGWVVEGLWIWRTRVLENSDGRV